MRKDKELFNQFNTKELETTYEVLNKYTKSLQSRLESIKENLK